MKPNLWPITFPSLTFYVEALAKTFTISKKSCVDIISIFDRIIYEEISVPIKNGCCTKKDFRKMCDSIDTSIDFKLSELLSNDKKYFHSSQKEFNLTVTEAESIKSELVERMSRLKSNAFLELDFLRKKFNEAGVLFDKSFSELDENETEKTILLNKRLKYKLLLMLNASIKRVYEALKNLQKTV